MISTAASPAPFPLPLSAYPAGDGLLQLLRARIEVEPFNAVATTIFLLAIVFRREGLLGQREIALDRLFARGGGKTHPTGRSDKVSEL